MMARGLRGMVVVFLVLGLLMACGTKPAQTPEAQPTQASEKTTAPPADSSPDVLRVWITWGDNPAQLQTLFNKYGDANNIKIEVNAPVETDKIIAALSGSEPPDVLVLSGPDDVARWVNEGLLIPLEELLVASGADLNDIYPAMLAQGRYKGKLYAVPWGSDTYALFWNKDLFEEAGLDPETPPKTLDELVEYAEKLTKVEADGSITQLGFVPDFSWSHLDQYVRMFGGYFTNNEGNQLTLTSEPVVAALKWEQQFYTTYNTEEVLRFVSSTGDYSSAEHGFMSGKIAMMVDGEWMTGQNFIGGLKPDLWYGVAPLPYPTGRPELANTNLVGGTVVVIPSNVKNKEAAAKLLAWMLSPEILAEEMVANFNLPSSKQAAQDPRFRQNEKFAIFMDLASHPNATHHIFNAIFTEVNTELGTIEEQVVHNGADPLPLLQEAQDKLQPMLDESLQ